MCPRQLLLATRALRFVSTATRDVHVPCSYWTRVDVEPRSWHGRHRRRPQCPPPRPTRSRPPRLVDGPSWRQRSPRPRHSASSGASLLPPWSVCSRGPHRGVCVCLRVSLCLCLCLSVSLCVSLCVSVSLRVPLCVCGAQPAVGADACRVVGVPAPDASEGGHAARTGGCCRATSCRLGRAAESVAQQGQTVDHGTPARAKLSLAVVPRMSSRVPVCVP
jgi:hypothetical protein